MDKWIDNGLYYGYPKCCIDSFCKSNGKLTKEQNDVHKNNGFIPCQKCSEKILAGEATLENLITNRVCKKVFPNG